MEEEPPVNKKQGQPTSEVVPMVSIKQEFFDDLSLLEAENHEIKKENEEFENIDLIGDYEEIDSKENIIPLCQTGIRMSISKTQKEVTMMSEMVPETSKIHTDSKENILPQHKPGTRIVIDRKQKEVTMISDMKQSGSSSLTKNSIESKKVEAPSKSENSIKLIKVKIVNNKVVTNTQKKSPDKERNHIKSSTVSKSDKNKKSPHSCSQTMLKSVKIGEKYVKTKGFLKIANSSSKFRIMNKTFEKSIKTTFYVKIFQSSHILVRTRSKSRNRYKVTLYEGSTETSGFCSLADNKFASSLALPITMFEGDFIKYKIVIYN